MPFFLYDAVYLKIIYLDMMLSTCTWERSIRLSPKATRTSEMVVLFAARRLDNDLSVGVQQQRWLFQLFWI